MRIFIIALITALLTTSGNAESLAEKRWRLRAEILERELELTKMELREKDGTSPEPASTQDFVNAYGTRFAALETDGTQVASLRLNRSSSVADTPDAAKTDTTKTKTTTKSTTTKSETTPPKTDEIPPGEVRDWPEQHQGAWGYQILKPSSRIYFDTGSDDPGEVDIFKDGSLGVSVDFLTISYDWGITDALSIGGFVAGGISSITSESDHSAILMWSAGIAVGIKDMPFSFEAGILQGISAGETLTDKTDTALFVGMSLTKPVAKRWIVPKNKPAP
jgi:hypothetical protein